MAWHLNKWWPSSMMFVQDNFKEIIKALHCWACVRGIHQWLVDSSHKGTVKQKTFPFHYILRNVSREWLETNLHYIMVVEWYFSLQRINSPWPSDAIRWHTSGSTLAQVMACCLLAPSHYLSQCWLIISKVQWHLSESNFITDTSVVILKFNHLKSHSNLPGELTHWGLNKMFNTLQMTILNAFLLK